MESKKVEDRVTLLLNSATFKEIQKYCASFFPGEEIKNSKKVFFFFRYTLQQKKFNQLESSNVRENKRIINEIRFQEKRTLTQLVKELDRAQREVHWFSTIYITNDNRCSSLKQHISIISQCL